jgi:hypothetical protein
MSAEAVARAERLNGLVAAQAEQFRQVLDKHYKHGPIDVKSFRDACLVFCEDAYRNGYSQGLFDGLDLGGKVALKAIQEQA